MTKKPDPLRDFQDQFNPMNLYCRLRDLDIDKPKCREICRWYNEVMYQPVKDYIEYGLKIDGLEEKLDG